MQQDIQRVLIDRQVLADRVAELAGEIASSELAERITLVPIMTGSFMFVADLIRHLPVRMRICPLSVSSYRGKSTQSGELKMGPEFEQMACSLAGAHVLIVDDILDSGQTLRQVTQAMGSCGVASLKTCVLLRKQREAALAFPVDHVAFDIPDEFVVGYGLDYNDDYRNLPDLVVLKPHVVMEAAQ